MKKLVIGTRQSELALVQAQWVKARLEELTDIPIELHKIVTKGDRILDVTLAKIGGKGLFVKEIEEALLNRTIDLAVHSMKDMPGELPSGLTLGAVTEREDPRDCFIAKSAMTLDDLPSGSSVGTSSLRRQAQVQHYRPDVRIVPLRGNVNTRLRKLEEGDLDGIVLAAAGLHRLNLSHRICQYLPLEISLPAVGQGALGIECREGDTEILHLLGQIEDLDTRRVVEAERSFLRRLEGSCQVPIGALGQLSGTDVVLQGFVADAHGEVLLRAEAKGTDPQGLGHRLAGELLTRGARDILEKVREAMAEHGTEG